MKIEKVPIGVIKEYECNAKLHPTDGKSYQRQEDVKRVLKI